MQAPLTKSQENNARIKVFHREEVTLCPELHSFVLSKKKSIQCQVLGFIFSAKCWKKYLCQIISQTRQPTCSSTCLFDSAQDKHPNICCQMSPGVFLKTPWHRFSWLRNIFEVLLHGQRDPNARRHSKFGSIRHYLLQRPQMGLLSAFYWLHPQIVFNTLKTNVISIE
mgnify:CR=1 FL=1